MQVNICIGKKYLHISLKAIKVRCSSSKNKVISPLKKKYSETVLLPKTSFPLRIASTKRTEVEVGIQEACNFNSLYAWQREALKEKPQFVLHDGPPYANGVPHMGHLVNKVLKDIITRFKLLTGFRVHYVPGWDCHGLPIELKVIKLENKQNYSPLEIREQARTFALSAIETQKKAFKRWGVMADWENCYLTLSKDYEITQLKAFFELYEKGFIFRDFKPVYWSPSTRSALAEAELEYNPTYQSICAYVKFPLKSMPDIFKPYAGMYSLVKSNDSEFLYIIGSDLCSTLEKSLSLQFDKIISFTGKALEGVTYIHPVRQEELRFLPAAHVKAQMGTGLVHSSPCHGFDDYNLGVKFNLPLKNYLDDDGCFTSECNEDRLRGKSVLDDANHVVLDLFGEHIVKTDKFIHSYPHDWRSKKPVIIKPSLQWFIDTDKIKNSALDFLKEIDVFPSNMKSGMNDQLNNRPSWCISRQRSWGLPISAFYEPKSKQVILNNDLLNHWCKLLEQHGSDMWWILPDSTLLPKQILEDTGLSTEAVYEKGHDILDIWFDSGISWKYVLSDANYQADVCLEGVDQSRGWFQSLLLTSVALQKKPPFKKLFYHGFVLDEQGRKMSKSIGNVVDPQVIVDGDKNKFKALGADVLRWWVATHVVEHSSVCIKQEILHECSQVVQKIRGVLRYLLSNLSDFDPSKDLISLEKMELIDRYILHLLYEYRQKYRASTYSEQMGLKRRSCQTTLHHLFLQLTYSIAPILPHLAEEAFLHHHQYGDKKKFVFRNVWPDSINDWRNPEIRSTVESAIQIGAILNKEITALSLDISEIDVTIEGSQSLMDALKSLHPDHQNCHSQLCELLRVASVTLTTQSTNDKAPISTIDASLKLENVRRLVRRSNARLSSTSSKSKRVLFHLKTQEGHSLHQLMRTPFDTVNPHQADD
uniref:isoleucine--tRNA ligase n=1 Tax=Strigamia maritima TaxID=126957 RepID=T1IPW0_STRMM